MSEQQQVTLLTSSQTSELGDVLSRAFYAEPNFVYMLPDERVRRAALPWFFRFVVQLGLQGGVVCTTPSTEGGAIWLRPNRSVTFRDTVRTGGLMMPFRFGWRGFRRSLQLDREIGQVRKRVAPDQHWYLLALGVAPSKQGHGLGNALLHPVLNCANTDNTPCYLETFKERLVHFYAQHGFTVVAEERVPKGGPPFWAMVREPPTLAVGLTGGAD